MGSLFGDRGLLHLFEQRERTGALQREIEELRAENRRLGSEIQALRTEPHSVERLAREQLGMARPGETIFILREDDPVQP